MHSSNHEELLNIGAQALELASRHGADSADVFIADNHALSSTVRLGKLENVECSQSRDLGLRVFCGKSQAIVSTSKTGAAALEEIARQAVEMARAAPEDPNIGLPDIDQSAPPLNGLDLFDSREPSAVELENEAREAEDAARAIDGVTNSIGASASHSVTAVALAASNGFSGHYRRSQYMISCSVLAGKDASMEQDYDYSIAVHREDLDSPDKIGRTAGARAVRRLGGRKMKTGKVPVVYNPRVASQLVGNLASALSGTAIARGASFLKERMGEKIFAKGINIIDDPTLTRGLRSRPFDAEGLSSPPLNLVKDARLANWLLDCGTARQLKLESNGRASRGVSSPPSPSSTNLYMAPGTLSPEELIADIKDGFYVMGLMGRGGSVITGDYSEGADGFRIKNGELSHPVTGVTIAGNLLKMYKHLTPANDLEFRGAINAPTLRVEAMTVAGT